jgi:hypothetical protein
VLGPDNRRRIVDALVFALTTKEWDFLLAGIFAILLGILVLVYEPALRILVALQMFVFGISAVVWALAD